MRHRSREAFEQELASVPVFAVLGAAHVQELAARATRAHEPKGMLFSREGERGDELVVVLDGTVEVRRGSEVVATLGRGEFFGEMALLDDTARRSATVVAVSPVVVAYLSRHHFDTLLADNAEFAAAVRRTVVDRAPGVPADPE